MSIHYSASDVLMPRYGENIMALCNFAARQDVQTYIKQNKCG